MQYKLEVVKVTEYRGKAIFKTEKVCEIWLNVKSRSHAEELAIAHKHGGDMLVSTHSYKPGKASDVD